jgi:hypothetical protein
VCSACWYLQDFYYNTQIIVQKHPVKPDVHVLALSGRILYFVWDVADCFGDFLFCLQCIFEITHKTKLETYFCFFLFLPPMSFLRSHTKQNLKPTFFSSLPTSIFCLQIRNQEIKKCGLIQCISTNSVHYNRL